MGSDSQNQIPAIAFTINSREVDRGTGEWHHLCKRVREACENYGCFQVLYDKISPQLRAETFSVTRELFGLPLEKKKKKKIHSKPYLQGYLGQMARAPLYESFGLEEASNYESLRSLTEEVWPNGHDQFCTVMSLMKQLNELKAMINLMILDSYGLGEDSNSLMESKTLLRLMKYSPPPASSSSEEAHTDKGFGTILCDDQVSGLEVETKDGQWIKLSLSPRCFVFIVGESLKAWSNCRMHSVKHRVVMDGAKERYSLGVFAVPLIGGCSHQSTKAASRCRTSPNSCKF